MSETPELSGTSYSSNVFDLSKSSLKDAVLFAIKFISDNPNAVIKVKLMVTIYSWTETLLKFADLFSLSILKVESGLNNLVVSKTSTLEPFTLNMNTLYVDLSSMVQDVNKEFFFLNMSASNDNTNFGNEITLTAVNSKTYTCNGFSCTPVVGDQTPSPPSSISSSKKDSFILPILAIIYLAFKIY